MGAAQFGRGLDAAAWFDYGQALESSGDSREAHTAYRKVIDLDESSAFAEQARTALAKK